MKRVFVVLLFLLGCEISDAPSFDPLAPTDPSLFPCEPACAPAFACEDGVCVPRCDPACPEGTACQSDGTCDASLADGAGDDFERNPCGGFGELSGTPGTSCGPCNTGRWLCETENLAVCIDPEGLNACGGCGALAGEPGTVCADEQRWACTPGGEVQCVDWFDANPCLGTADLNGAFPGRACGDCNEGFYRCAGVNEVQCELPTVGSGLCACQPGVSPPVACGTDAGLCERGVRFCGDDGLYGACVVGAAGEGCETDASCGQGVCVDEQVDPYESLDDACVRLGDEACTRRVCRTPETSYSCDSDLDCLPEWACARGACRRMVRRPTDERCNGVDDDCDGLIDDDHQRANVCGACPYNMMLLVNSTREYGRRRVCIDIFEAARPDASAEAMGEETRWALSQAYVMPWSDVSADEAVAACAGAAYNTQIPGGVAERRLCVVDEWQLACNIEGHNFPYGEAFEPRRCNDASTGTSPVPTTAMQDCQYTVPGGVFPIWDFSGNVAEWIRGDEGTFLAGGSFADTGDALSCGAVATRVDTPNAAGFRCCVGAIARDEPAE